MQTRQKTTQLMPLYSEADRDRPGACGGALAIGRRTGFAASCVPAKAPPWARLPSIFARAFGDLLIATQIAQLHVFVCNQAVESVARGKLVINTCDNADHCCSAGHLRRIDVAVGRAKHISRATQHTNSTLAGGTEGLPTPRPLQRTMGSWRGALGRLRLASRSH